MSLTLSDDNTLVDQYLDRCIRCRSGDRMPPAMSVLRSNPSRPKGIATSIVARLIGPTPERTT
jgi:hypothetical protein